jgi:hypothetical protein
LPLEARKVALAKLLEKSAIGIHLVEHTQGNGATVFARACKLRFEGIVSKHREHPYRSGPSFGGSLCCSSPVERTGGVAPSGRLAPEDYKRYAADDILIATCAL